MGRYSKVLFLATALTLLVAGGAQAGTGDIFQKTGTDACVSEDGTGGLCADGRGLNNATDVVTSPDGLNTYVIGQQQGPTPYAGAIATFDRDPLTGRLTQKAGESGCISRNVVAGCKTSTTINRPFNITVSPDGKSVYVVDTLTQALSVFDRNTSTGELTQKAGAAGCFSDGTLVSCTVARGFEAPRAVEVSPDGEQVYVASLGSGSEPSDEGIAVLNRDTTTGALTQKAGTDGCVSDDGNGGDCADGLFVNPSTLAISPDGENVYAGSSDLDVVSPEAINIFDRDPDGTISQKAAPEGCITESGSAGICGDGLQIKDSSEVAVSPDGNSVYVSGLGLSADSPKIGSVTAFDRGTAGGLTQKAGAAGCFTLDGTSGACTTTVALDQPQDLVVADDSVYVSASGTNQGARAIVNLDRDVSSGALVQKAGSAGCVSGSSLGACTVGTALSSLRFLALSPAGDSLYAAAAVDNAVAIFDRDNGVAPVTSIDSGPEGEIIQNNVSFLFQADESGASFECSLDGASFTACASPQSYNDLELGDHNFRVRATDTFGNVEAVPAERSFSIVEVQPPGTASLRITGFSPKKPVVKKNRKLKVKVVSRNTGTAAASRTKVCLSIPRASRKALKPKGKSCQSLATLGANRSKTAVFNLNGTAKVKKGKRYKLVFRLSAEGGPAVNGTVVVKGK